MNEIEVLSQLKDWEDKLTNKERDALDKAIIVLQQKEKLKDLIEELEVESKDFECCLELLERIKKELEGVEK